MTHSKNHEGYHAVVIAFLFVTMTFSCFVLTLFVWNMRATTTGAPSEVLAMSITALEVVLAVLAILLGLGAFVGFWMIKLSAQEAARDEARNFMEVEGPKLVEQVWRMNDGEDPRKGSGHFTFKMQQKPPLEITEGE